MESKVKKVAILTNGGDAPGLNAVIRAIVKTARTHGVECYGFIEGYKGLLNNEYVKLDLQGNASGLLTKGGTIIGTSNATNVFNYKVVNEDGTVEYKDLSDVCVQNIKDDGFDCLCPQEGRESRDKDLALRRRQVAFRVCRRVCYVKPGVPCQISGLDSEGIQGGGDPGGV